MTRRVEEPLTHEDRILWNRVARTIAPMPGKALAQQAAPADDFGALLDGAAAAPDHRSQPAAPARPARRVPQSQHRIDRPTRDKLANGRLAIDGKVDLHGLTQSEAHSLLFSFLHRAHAEGRRHVLVVTGKGSSLGSEGALKRAVPIWLATPAFRAIVGAHESAARGHGGGGALYVRLRRQGGTP